MYRHLDLTPPPLGHHRSADWPDSGRMREAGLPEVRRVVRGLGRAFLYLSIDLSSVRVRVRVSVRVRVRVRVVRAAWARRCRCRAPPQL